MEFISPTIPWYAWISAGQLLLFWFVWLLLLGTYVTGSSLPRGAIRIGFVAFAVIFFVSSSAASVSQYQAFKSGPIGRLPQNEFISYWLGYSELHYWRAWIVGIGVALVFAAIFWLIKKYSSGMLINQEEAELALLFGFFNPWPQTAVYFILAFLLFVLASLGLTLTFKLSPSFFMNGAMGRREEANGEFIVPNFLEEPGAVVGASRERPSGDVVANSRSVQAKIRNWSPELVEGRNSVNLRSTRAELANVGAQDASGMHPPASPFEPPRLTITPFLFIAAFFAPIITRPILLDWLHLGVIFITTT